MDQTYHVSEVGICAVSNVVAQYEGVVRICKSTTHKTCFVKENPFYKKVSSSDSGLQFDFGATCFSSSLVSLTLI